MEWKLVREDVKRPNWNEIIRSPYPVSPVRDALLPVNMDRVSKQTIIARTGDKPWFVDQSAIAHREKQRAYSVWSRNKTQADWEGV